MLARYHVEKPIAAILYSSKVEINSFSGVLMFYFVLLQTKFLVLAVNYVNFNS